MNIHNEIGFGCMDYNLNITAKKHKFYYFIVEVNI